MQRLKTRSLDFEDCVRSPCLCWPLLKHTQTQTQMFRHLNGFSVATLLGTGADSIDDIDASNDWSLKKRLILGHFKGHFNSGRNTSQAAAGNCWLFYIDCFRTLNPAAKLPSSSGHIWAIIVTMLDSKLVDKVSVFLFVFEWRPWMFCSNLWLKTTG